MIVSFDEILQFIGLEQQYFTVNASCNTLILKYNLGVAKPIVIPDGTYTAEGLAKALEVKMNADLTMTGTVVYNTTTKKFEIDAGVGNTIVYTHANSNGGFFLGFIQDKSAQIIISDNPVVDSTADLYSLHLAVEEWVKKECRRNFELALYKEVYDGDDSDILILKQIPIVSILGIGFDRKTLMYVRNVDAFAMCSIAINTTGIVLVKNGVFDDSITFALNATLDDFALAINSVGSGWEANVVVGYESYPSSELLPIYGANCSGGKNVELSIIDHSAEDGFMIYPQEGYIFNSNKWPEGKGNIFVNYIAGYVESAIPQDIKMAIKILVKYQYQKLTESSFGLNSYSLAGISQSFVVGGIPDEANRIISSYRDVYLGG